MTVITTIGVFSGTREVSLPKGAVILGIFPNVTGGGHAELHAAHEQYTIQNEIRSISVVEGISGIVVGAIGPLPGHRLVFLGGCYVPGIPELLPIGAEVPTVPSWQQRPHILHAFEHVNDLRPAERARAGAELIQIAKNIQRKDVP